jgi:hypothetical protein
MTTMRIDFVPRVPHTKELFDAIRGIIPEIPLRAKCLTITLKHDEAPLITCEFFPGEMPCEAVTKRFTISEIEETANVPEHPRPVTEAT